MSEKCYYEVLGLAKGADIEVVRKQGKKTMALAHPDRGGDEADFKEKNEAYTVLKDEKKKAAYDEGGFAALEELENGGGSSTSRAPSFGDMFEEAFGKAGSDKTAGGTDDTANLFKRARARRGVRPGPRRAP